MSYDDALRSHLERSLRTDLGLGPIEPDCDGDYAVVHEGVVVWARVLDEPEPLARVWAHAAYGVKKSARVLTEVNDFNAGCRLLRCFWTEGTVIIAAETRLESVEPGDLGGLVEHVGAAARHTGELVAAVFGGQAAVLPKDLLEPELPEPELPEPDDRRSP